MKDRDYVTLVDVDGYDCSYDDKIVVTMGFNRWEMTMKSLREQVRSDRPTFVCGYNIDPTKQPRVIAVPYDCKDIPGYEHVDSDKYFRLTSGSAQEMLESWEENREGKIENEEDMDVEPVRDFISTLEKYLVKLRSLELGIDTGFGIYPQDYEDYQKMLELKKTWEEQQ